MEYINISNHPEIPTIKRKATRHSLLVDDDSQTVVLTLRVKHFKEVEVPSEIEGEPSTIQDVLLTTVKDCFPILRVDNNTMVDIEGNIVDDDSPQAVMTEWNFFNGILGSMPVVIDDLIASKTAWADSLGKLNNFY